MRFCTACQSTQEEEGGVLRRTAKTARWMCKGCAEKRTPSIYQTSGKLTANYIKRLQTGYYTKGGGMRP